MGKGKFPKRHGQPWQKGEIESLRKWVDLGISEELIAGRLERTEFAVRCVIEKLDPIVKEIPSKRLVINGRDYDKILDVAKHLVSDKAILSAEMYLAFIGSPVGFLNKMR